MPIAIDPREETPFVLARERASAKPTKFWLKALTSRQFIAITDAARVIGPDATTGELVVKNVNVGLMLCDFATAALTRVEDMDTKDGKPFRFRRGDLSFLSADDVQEIGIEVQSLNKLTEVEAKN